MASQSRWDRTEKTSGDSGWGATRGTPRGTYRGSVRGAEGAPRGSSVGSGRGTERGSVRGRGSSRGTYREYVACKYGTECTKDECPYEHSGDPLMNAGIIKKMASLMGKLIFTLGYYDIILETNIEDVFSEYKNLEPNVKLLVANEFAKILIDTKGIITDKPSINIRNMKELSSNEFYPFIYNPDIEDIEEIGDFKPYYFKSTSKISKFKSYIHIL